MRVGVYFTTLSILAMGCSEGPPATTPVAPAAPADDGSAQQAISADTGGTVSFHDEVTLNVPPHSLSADTTIGIERITDLPQGDSDGLGAFGQAYRCTPAGTQFALSHPAQMIMHYDTAALVAKGYDPQTVRLYYFDEELKRYFNVPGVVDTASGTVTARIEHFTVYVPFAQTLTAGNHPPTVSLQATLPSPVRAGAPILVRATVKDFDVNGAVAGVSLSYRVTSTTAWNTVPMVKDQSTNAADSFQYIIPASFTAGMAIGATLDYFVQATDNLNAVSPVPSPLPTMAIAHTYKPASLAVAPNALTITSGFSRLLNVTAKDEASLTYAIVPDSATLSNNVGTITSNSSSGVAFTAGKVATGNLTVTVGVDTAAVPVTVSNGALNSITILGPTGMPSTGTLVLTEGQHYNFDAIGQDAYGNTIYVLPNWTFAPGYGAAGYIDPATGSLYTLDAENKVGNVSYWSPGFSTITATVGSVTATQWVQINPRTWTELGALDEATRNEYDPTLALLGSTPYLSYSAYDPSVGFALRVKHWNGAAWIADPDPVAQAISIDWPRLAACGNTLYLAYAVDYASVYELHVVRLAGNLWIDDGGVLNALPTVGALDPSIACDGATPYVSWVEGGAHVYVKKFDGSSWVGVGGPVEQAGTSGIQATIAVHAGAPWVALSENDTVTTRVNVRQWTGTAWAQVGSVLSTVHSPEAWPNIKWGLTQPWVAFGDGVSDDKLSYWNGTSWILEADAGGSIVNSGTPPALAMDGDTAYWGFSNHYNGPDGAANWVHHASPINNDYATDSIYPVNNYIAGRSGGVLTMGPSTPYHATMEGSTTTGLYVVHVRVLK